MVVTSFLLLVLTGMPLKFYYTSWAKVIFSILGGAEVARALHHFGAIITFAYFGLHLVGLADRPLEEARGPAQPRDRPARAAPRLGGALRPGLDGARRSRT